MPLRSSLSINKQSRELNVTEHVSCVFYVYVQHTVNLHDEFIFKPEKSKATDYTKNTLTARKQVTIVLLKEILQIHCRLASFWRLQVEDGLQPINMILCPTKEGVTSMQEAGNHNFQRTVRDQGTKNLWALWLQG